MCRQEARRLPDARRNARCHQRTVGSASQFIDVPDIDKGRLALSGIVLRAELPQAKAPAGPDHPEGQQATDIDPQGTPAVRIFKPGTAIIMAIRS